MNEKWLLCKIKNAQDGKQYKREIIFSKKNLLTTDGAIEFLLHN